MKPSHLSIISWKKPVSLGNHFRYAWVNGHLVRAIKKTKLMSDKNWLDSWVLELDGQEIKTFSSMGDLKDFADELPVVQMGRWMPKTINPNVPTNVTVAYRDNHGHIELDPFRGWSSWKVID